MIRYFLLCTLLVLGLQSCGNKGENQNANTEQDTLSNVPEENIRSTGDERSVPSEADSTKTDSIK
jgi:predicted small lipoprotein YifL